MDGATCCWGAYTCYTWCIGSYTDKKNVSLQATSNVLSFSRWQKSQIVWACVHGESAGMGEKPRGISKPPTPVWPIGEASCSPFHPSDLNEAPQHHLLRLSLRPLDLNLFSEHPPTWMLQSSASSDFIVQNPAGTKRPVLSDRASLLSKITWLFLAPCVFLAMSGENS